MRAYLVQRWPDASSRNLENTDYYSMLNEMSFADTFSVTDGIGIAIDNHGYSDEESESVWLCFDDPDTKDEYEKYSVLTGDTCFNQSFHSGYPAARAIITPLQSITVTANRDFSEHYKAGSDLSNLFMVFFEDPYSVVKNGYTNPEGYFTFMGKQPFGDPSYPPYIVRVRLSEANFPERPFIDDKWVLFLEEAPEETGEYTFHIKVTYTDGRMLETSAPPIHLRGCS
jgi:hypothetical protein